ncbi:RodZ family helix-turn-helix domain-containing protein [uncultured Adlercreutzia sp.]|uniref:helix-turn-helix domain-containing protein n=1 Tax=uncultured Adlercreutzia sp. TaxID=875803 RepID=UPI0026F3F7E6|nr:helix-turn-helix transcriptional regulator [uncultured Adlercreutzia sp.]
MARQTSFGDMLAAARERKGLDLSTAARKLRIRPDILRAIEEGDFARMPPRGYTTNMVSAYARLVGLNPTEVTRAYRDEAYQFETGRRPAVGRDSRTRGDSRALTMPSARGGASRASGREERGTTRSSRGGYGSSRGRTPAPQPQYTNLVQGRQAPGIAASLGSMLPLIVVGAVIVGLLVLVIVLAFGNRAAPEQDTPTVPISGLPNPAGTDTGATGQSAEGTDGASSPTVSPVAPTSAKFTYTVADGKEVYIEVVQDGKTLEAGNVTGPKNAEYSVTDKLKFILSGDPEDVELTVDGEKVEPVDQNGRGVYTYTVDFEEVLEDWKRENGVSTGSSGDDAASGEGEQGGSDGDSDADSDGESSSDDSDTTN